MSLAGACAEARAPGVIGLRIYTSSTTDQSLSDRHVVRNAYTLEARDGCVGGLLGACAFTRIQLKAE